MKSLKLISVLTAVMFLSACAHDLRPQAVIELPNERIEYRDLTIPTAHNRSNAEVKMLACDTGHTAEVIPQTTNLEKIKTTCQKNRHFFTVAFNNESTVLNKWMNADLASLQKIVLESKDDHFVIIGHSHGTSAKGNNFLASQRSERVYNWLVESGVDPKKLHRFASWSPRKELFAPAIGVQIFKVKDDYTITLNNAS